MAENPNQEMLTTAQAAKLLGVRADTVHAMKAEGQLTVVGKGSHGTNLFALTEIEKVKVLRLKAQRALPAQAQLPAESELACDGCRALRDQVLVEREGKEAAEARAREADGRAERAMAALTAAVG
ncbi:helix-turn-helix domain-containing protein [Streptomyces sp. NPDC015684]|uniref:helix-turn-helix domain-containing protein n=1 Tax=Streptomyces sp. NPDC015684 TaxID=3364963 RepID=UPI0036FAC215